MKIGEKTKNLELVRRKSHEKRPTQSEKLRILFISPLSPVKG
jgi:hypothetical protein